MWMLKQEAFLQSPSTHAPPPINLNIQNNQNVSITFTGPTIPGLTPPSAQISVSPKGILSLLLEGIVGNFNDTINGPDIVVMQKQPQGVIFLHKAENRQFGKWGSEFVIEYNLSIGWTP
jgi:hypothetical protein